MTNNRNQEGQGLLSPWLRDQRLKVVARRIPARSTVLDLACGTGALRNVLAADCAYYGVDRIPLSGLAWSTTPNGVKPCFTCVDLASAKAPDTIAAAMSIRPDVITMIAFMEHLREPAKLVSRYISLLPPGGRLIGTTPHPRGRWVHDALASVGICSKDGAEEHEQFLGKVELAEIARQSGAEMTHYQVFLMGLNQAFEFTR